MSSTIARASLAQRPAENVSLRLGDVDQVVPHLGRAGPATAWPSRRRGRGRPRRRRPRRSPRRPAARPRGRGPSCPIPSGRGAREAAGADRAHGLVSPRQPSRVFSGRSSTRAVRPLVRAEERRRRSARAPRAFPAPGGRSDCAGRRRGGPRAGATASRNAGVVDVRLPWWPTLRTSTAPAAPRPRSACLRRRADVAREQGAAAVPLEESHDRLVVDAVDLAHRPARVQDREPRALELEDVRRHERPDRDAAPRGEPRRRASKPPSSSPRAPELARPAAPRGRRRDRGHGPGADASSTPRRGASLRGRGASARRRVRPNSVASRSNGPPPSTSIALRFQRRSIASPCPTSRASIEKPRFGPARPGRERERPKEQRRRRAAAAATQAARPEGRGCQQRADGENEPEAPASAAETRSPPLVRRATPEAAIPGRRGPRGARPEGRTRRRRRRAPPRAISTPESGIDRGAVSQAPAATRLNRQKRTGAVAHSAASAAANPDHSQFGPLRQPARIGSAKSAIPQTAANVSTVPTEKSCGRRGKEQKRAPRARSPAPSRSAARAGASRGRPRRRGRRARPAGSRRRRERRGGPTRGESASRVLPSTPASERTKSTSPASSTTCSPETTSR